MFHFPYLFLAMGGYTFTIKFISLVSIGRVFHHCHYFGDTFIGALLGYAVAAGFFYSEIEIGVPASFDQMIFEFVRSGRRTTAVS
jgi:hypothetical protein